VGRISAGNATEAGRQVSKIISYGTWNAAPITTLLLGEQADAAPTWGGDMLDYLYHQMGGIPRDMLYDRNGEWTASTLIDVYLNSNTTNTVFHMGHSNESTVMKMGVSDAASLTNTNPFFIYTQGCYAGAFDFTDCMAEAFTVKGAGGAHAVIMNSRYGWYTPASVFGTSNLFHREFLQALYEEGVRRLGDANNSSKERMSPMATVDGSVRWCMYDITLFGDPATQIHWQCTSSSVHLEPESPGNSFHVLKGDSFVLRAAVGDNCVEHIPPAQLQVRVDFDNGDDSVSLHDDGISPDAVAGDGHFSGTWSPSRTGPVTLSFSATASGLSPAGVDVDGEIVPSMDYTRLVGDSPWIDTSAGDVLSTGDLLGNTDDGGWIVSIGFPFLFYGVEYSDMMVGTNGLVQMEHGSFYSSTEENFPLPYDGDDNGIIAPFWCDLNPATSGTVRVLREGVAPNRIITIEWHDVRHYDSSGAATFQLSLYESSNRIVFRYQDASFGDVDFDYGADASIGIEGPNGIHGRQLLFHEAGLTDGDSMILVPFSPVDRVFVDDFESGDFSQWSAVMGAAHKPGICANKGSA